MNYKTRSLTALAFAAVAGSALAQSNFTLTGPITIAGPAGDAGNSVIAVPGTVAAQFVSSTAVTVSAVGVLTRVHTLNTPSDIRIRLRNSAYPNGVFDFQISNGGVYVLPAGTLAVAAAGRAATSGTIHGCVIPAGSSWTIEFFTVVDNPGTEATLSAFTAVLPVGTALPTNVLQSIDVTGTYGSAIPTFGFLGDPANITVTVPDNQTSGSKFIANGGWILESAAVSKPSTLVQSASTMTVYVKHSSSNLQTTIQPWFGAVLNSPATWTNYQAGTKVAPKVTYNHNTAVLTGGGNWTFEFYESTNTPDVDQDGQWDDLKLKITGTAVPATAETLTWSGAADSVDSPGDSDNNTVSLGSATTTYTLSPNAIFSGTSTAGYSAMSQTRDALVRIYNSAYKYDYSEIWFSANNVANATSLNWTGTESTAINCSSQYGGYLLNGGLTNRIITAGSTFTAEFAEDRDDSSSSLVQQEVNDDAIPERGWTSLSLGTVNAAYVAPAAPTATVDLGTLTGGSYSAALPNFLASAVKWVKFTIPEVDRADCEYIDIWTQPNANTITTTRLTDSIIGLYSADGRLIQQDDDDSFGFNSCLSFGMGNADARAPKQTTSGDTYSDSKKFNGRDGKGLEAGTYYLGVVNFSASGSFGRGFAVAGTGTARVDGTNVKIKMGTGKITGAVLLQDWVPTDLSTVVPAWELRDGVTDAVVASGTTTLSSGGNYSLLTEVPAGSYTLTMKASHWLKEGIAVTVGGACPNINFSLINGDINNDNFVGFDDFDILSAAFGLSLGDPGYQVGADLNGDDFNGFDDFDILSAHFGEAGY